MKTIGKTGPVTIRPLRLLAIFILISLLSAANALASDPENGRQAFEAIGSSRIYKNNVQAAKNAALKDAFNEAVEQAVGKIIAADVLAANFQAVCESVLSRSEDFVLGYKNAAESQTEKQVWVLCRVNIDEAALSQTLRESGAMASAGDLPVLLFLVNEREVGQKAPRHWWGKAVSQALTPRSESILSDAMAAKGFSSVDGRAAIRAMVAGPMFDPESFDLEQAVELGRNSAAGVVIVGEASARRLSHVTGTDMKSYEGAISLKTLNAETGLIIGISSQTSTVVSDNDEAGGAEAIEKASILAANELIPLISEAFKPQEAEPMLIDIHIQGRTPLKNQIAFRNALKRDLQGISKVIPKAATGMEYIVQVEFAGDANELTKRLMLLSFEDFTVSIMSMEAGRIGVELIGAP